MADLVYFLAQKPSPERLDGRAKNWYVGIHRLGACHGVLILFWSVVRPKENVENGKVLCVVFKLKLSLYGMMNAMKLGTDDNWGEYAKM